MRSQTGPLSSLPFTVLPTNRFTRFDPQPFRVLLLRRLHLPLSVTARQCRCGRPLDACGHHRSACAVAGVLGRRGYLLETAVAQVCREAGARVRLNTMVRDLDLLPGALLDNRRLEVVADGLPLFNGAQLAIDTTMVSALRGDGTARRRAQEESQKRLAELRALQVAQPGPLPPPADASAEVSRPVAPLVVSPSGVRSGTTSRPREQEVLEWFGRSSGRHEHGLDGRESIRSSSHFGDDHRCDQKFATSSAAFDGHRHGEMTCVSRSSKYGLRGVRVGEASNPEPQSPRRRSPSQDGGEPNALCVDHLCPKELLDVLQQDLSDNRHHRRTRRRVVSSDNDASIPQRGPGVVSRRVATMLGLFHSGQEVRTR